MIYCETINKECIAVHPMDDVKSTHYVELVKYGDTPQFAVYVDDGDDEWVWEFDMECPSDYERVKLNIFDAIYECDTMVELASAFDAIFKNYFSEILIEDECSGCDYCNGCEFAH